MKRWWWFVISISGLLALSGVGLWSFRNSRNTDVQYNSAGGSVALGDNNQPSDGNSQPLPTDSPNPTSGSTPAPTPSSQVLSVTQSNTGLQVTPAPSAQTDDPNAEKQAPGPEAFGQYNAYASYTEAQFGEIRAGTGAVASVGKSLKVHYRGWLINGSEFDESYQRGQPYEFVMGAHKVILGWEQGIYGMKVGGKRRLIIPPSVGYGSNSQGSIPANSVLVFDVELMAVN